MPAYPEESTDLFDYQTSGDWREVIDSSGGASPGSSHLSNDAQEAVLVGYVPWRKQRSAARFFLGYAECDTASPYRLYRENPHRHPIYPWLYAYDISFTPYIVKSNPDEENDSPFLTGPFDGWDGLPLYAAYHHHVIATVRYRNFRCDFLPDSDISENQYEWRRNAYFDVEPSIEALQVTGGQATLKFAEGGAAPAPAVNTPFAAPVAQLLSKAGFTLHWLNVPMEYLSSAPYYFYPSKILACVGTVNSETLFSDGTNSFKAGTMLLAPPQWTIKTAPVADEDYQFPRRYVDMVLRWDYFEPTPKGSAGSAYHGHVLMPWSGDGTLARPGDGKWYMCTRDGALTGTLTTEATIIKYTNHRNVFLNINEPTLP